MPRYKGWSRGSASTDATNGSRTSEKHGEQYLLNTGPVVLGFTPVNNTQLRTIPEPASKSSMIPDRTDALFDVNQRTESTIQSGNSETMTRKRNSSSKVGENFGGRPVKQARIRTDNVPKTKSLSSRNSKENNHLTLAKLPAAINQSYSQLGDNPVLWELPDDVLSTGQEDLDESICDEDLLDLVNGQDDHVRNAHLLDSVDDPGNIVCGKDSTNLVDDLEEDICDEDLLCAASTFENGIAPASPFAPAHPRLNWMEPQRYGQPQEESVPGSIETTKQGNTDKNNPVVFASLSSSSSSISSVTVKRSPLSPSKQAEDVTSTSPSVPQTPRHLQPFLTSPVPATVGDRSPISGVASHPRIVTHFRLGQALQFAAACTRKARPQDAIVELYARVLGSVRQGGRQSFRLADLFHYNRPPYLSGEWVGWKGLPYFELDGQAFLGESNTRKICRAIGRIEKDENAANGWRMCVLSIWEATWDDVENVKGIVCM